MAKPKKYPKSPKSGASLQVWERYRARVQEVDKHNAQIIADKKKKEAVKKQVQSIKAKRK